MIGFASVIHGARALRENDFVQFDAFMLQSHESSRDYFKNSTRELDLLAVMGCTYLEVWSLDVDPEKLHLTGERRIVRP